MGFVLSMLYFVTYYLTPELIFGPLAAYRVELILAVLITFISLPALMRSFILKTPQSLAIIGLAGAVWLSVVVAGRWLGGGVQSFLDFVPNTFGYFLVCLHFNSKRKLQALVVLLLFVCLFVLANGGLALRNSPADIESTSGTFAVGGYLLAMRSDAGQWFYRLRGLGEIHDPNDFGQLIVCVMPLVFIFWRPKRILSNIVCVILPMCALLVGVFLTHSRGALLALTVLFFVMARRRIGTVPALLLAGGIVAASIALYFTGGREISVSAGEDRTALWGQSLQLLKVHPLFGVGYGKLGDYLGYTAHNSVAVCASELGLLGLFFWCLFLFPTLRDALAISSSAKVSEGKPIIAEPGLFPEPTREIEVLDKAEVIRLGRPVVLSLVGFLVTGWFLSRAFVMTLFLLGGMAEVIYELSLERGMIAPRLGLARVLLYASALAILSLLILYIMLRTVNATH
jgi:hypothetical protein